MNLVEAYYSVYNTEENLTEDLYSSVLNLCIVEDRFDSIEECEEFAEYLIAEDLIEDFVVALLEYYEVENLNESLDFLGENRATALRAVINALSSGGRLKAGLKAGTALGKKPESVVRGAAASTSIRSARAARPAAQPELPGKYAAMQFKKGIEKAVTQKALPAAKPAPAAKKVSGAAADPWKQFMSKKQKQYGLPKEGPSSRVPNRVLPGTAAASTKALPAAGQSSAKKPSTMRYDIRATGPGGDARTQRLATQAAPSSGVRPKANAMTSPADALNAARKALATAAGLGAAGVAAQSGKEPVKKSKPESSVNKYNTMDSDGKIRSRLKVGPKIVGTGSVAGDFDVAFKKARESGSKEFEFKGKKYNTKLRGEEVDYFDIVMEHLISEGYVDTNEDALIMMASLDENAIAKIAAGAIKNVIKTGGSQLTKTKLPPKLDPAMKFVKDKIRQMYGDSALVGSAGYKYDAARRAAELRKNPPPKPKLRDPFPGDVYSKDGLGGIRGYRSGD